MQMRALTPSTMPTHAVASYPAPAMLAGLVERVLYHNPTGPYTVALLRPDGAERSTGVAGSFPEVRPGEYLRCTGAWEIHDRYGRQFRASEVVLVLPASTPGIRQYLSSPLVSGIGPVTAQRLVDQFGAGTLVALDAGPETLRQVPGIGPLRAQRISASWQLHQAFRDVMLTLFAYGLSYRRAEQLYQHYGPVAPLVLRSDPYRLTADVRGIGFLTADRIAEGVGIPPDAPGRLQAGLLHCMQAAAIAGHVWVPEARLLEEGEALLARRPTSGGDGQQSHIGTEQLAPALQALIDANKVAAASIAGEPGIALAALDKLERALSVGLVKLAEETGDRLPYWSQLDEQGWLRAFATHAGSVDHLSLEQRAAVQVALTQHVAVLTGGPGTGKTTTLRALVALALDHGARIALAAPTGKAARRLAEATGLEARTVHRLLGRRGFAGPTAVEGTDIDVLSLEGIENSGNDSPARGNPKRAMRLSADLVVIDEASMLDLPLARALVKAIPAGAHLLLVGDADQLPSVGPGQVLADIIAAGRFPVCRLQRIFRQGEGSGIAANAQRINA
ncbi:MAG TPA: AAA family ATPase, partial [Chloroflexota bacterium]